MKTLEPLGPKHAKISAGPKYEDLPEIEDYDHRDLEKFEKPEFEKAQKLKKVIVTNQIMSKYTLPHCELIAFLQTSNEIQKKSILSFL